MHRGLMIAVLLCAVAMAAQTSGSAKGKQATKTASHSAQATPPVASMHCEPLPPIYRTDTSRVVLEKITPNTDTPTGNIYFFMPRPARYIIVHLSPRSSDVVPYAVKLITRYADDTIFEYDVKAITPKADQPYHWGPYPVMPPAVPKDKIANMFNVKVQENYAMDPAAKGFTFTVSVDGCN